MFIIWGFGRRTIKKHGQTAPMICVRCNNNTPYTLMTVRTWFTLFWIPIIPYQSKNYSACPICNYAYDLTKEQLAQEMAGQTSWRNDIMQPSFPATGSSVPPPPVIPSAGQDSAPPIQ